VNPPDPGLLTDAVRYLHDLAARSAAPDEAVAALAPVAARHPSARLDLLWEEEGFDGSFHYDALIRERARGAAGGATISLSVVPDGGLPWPLRGTQRWRDSDLLRVNGRTLAVAEAVAQLDVLWDSPPLMTRLIDACLVEEALAADPVAISGEELQAAVDAVRRRRGLVTAEQTRQWMGKTGMTHRALEVLATRIAVLAKLRDRVAGGRVETFFAERAADFDPLDVLEVVATAPEALDPLRSAASHPGHVAATVLRAALAGAAAGGDRPRVVVERATRSAWEARLGASLRGKGAGASVGPVAAEEGLRWAYVLRADPARLDAPTRAAVKAALFEAWLAERRRTARVEWFWGDARRTAREVAPQEAMP
jgi:putative peptide maturation system protein